MARLGRGRPNRPTIVVNGRQDTSGRLNASLSASTFTTKATGTTLTATAPGTTLTARTTP